jgi:hypothetical protein
MGDIAVLLYTIRTSIWPTFTVVVGKLIFCFLFP